jgi:hypothetical protein
LNDPIRLDAATRICVGHVVLGVAVFAVFNAMAHMGFVADEDASVPMLMAFGWVHVVGGLAIMMTTRSWTLKRKPTPYDSHVLPIQMAGMVTGVGMVVMGGFIDLWLCWAIMSGMVA